MRTLFEKVWSSHVVAELSGGVSLLAIDRHLLHDLEGGASMRRIADRGLKVHNPELTFSVPDHAVATAPDRHAELHAEQQPPAARDEGRLRSLRHHLFRSRHRGPGHRPRDRSGARPEPARHDDRLRRQSHLHAWRARRAVVRYRRNRNHARARDADLAPDQTEDDAHQARRQACGRRCREGRHSRHHRPDRHWRRPRPCGRICGHDDPGDERRSAAHGLQSVDRARREDRNDRARRHDIFLSGRPALCAEGRDVRPGLRLLA